MSDAPREVDDESFQIGYRLGRQHGEEEWTKLFCIARERAGLELPVPSLDSMISTWLRESAAAQPQLSAGLRAARAWRAGRVETVRVVNPELAEALDALAAVVP